MPVATTPAILSAATVRARITVEADTLIGEAYFVEHNIPVLIPDGCMLIWDNWRMIHARSRYTDPARHLTRYWLA